MTSRERVFTAMAHKQPDRCPADLLLEGATSRKLQDHFKVKSEQELLDILDIDIQFVRPESTLPPTVRLPDGSWYDSWGSRLRMVKNGFCEYAERISRPLEDMEDLEDIKKYDKWPDPTANDWAHFSEKIGNLHEKRVLKLPAGGLYEIAWTLRGQENFLMDMVTAPEIPHYIMGKICDFWCEYISLALKAAGDKIDIVYVYDDIATQASLIMSPQMLEEFIYPYHRRVNAVIKSFGKKILYHSCGCVISQIENLRNLPIDILCPMQTLAVGMDFQKIKDTWGDSLCFHGGIDIQQLLPRGTVAEVQEAVRKTISVLGNKGGYILAPAHAIQNDTPIENIIAMYDVSIR